MSIRILRLASGLALAMLAAACKDERPAVSLEQAKQLTAQIQSQGFAPPPRSIADITAVLDEQKPDPARAAANRKLADAEPPAGASDTDLSRFYFTRGIAAAELGRADQRVADLRQAAALGRKAGIKIDRAMQNLAIAETQVGNALSARRAIEDWMREIPDNVYGERLIATAQLATTHARLGDFAAAERQLADAKQMLANAPSAARKSWPIFAEDWTAGVLTSEGVILSIRGRPGEAEKVLREALANREISIGKYDAMQAGNPSPYPKEQLETGRDLAILALARTLTMQGRLVEAEVEARRLLLKLLQRRGRDAAETAGATIALAHVIEREGRYAEAERLARAAIGIYETIGAGDGSWALAEARSLLADAQAAQGRWQEALATFRIVDRQLANDPPGHEKFVGASLSLAIVYINLGQPDAAIPMLRRVVESATRSFGETSAATAEARGLLGAALAEASQREAALAEFTVAVPLLMRPSREIAVEDEAGAVHDRRREAVLEAYVGALADAQGTSLAAGLGDIAAASFPIADAIRGRSVQRALAASGARAAVRDPALAQLVRQEQDARTQIAALQGVLTASLAAPLEQQDQAALKALRSSIDTLRSARAALREEIERRFPDYANLIDPRPATVAQVRAALHPGEALIATYVGERRSFVWAVSAEGEAAFAAVAMGRAEVATAVATLRRALDPAATTLGDIPPFDVARAYALFRAFLQPVERGWRSAKSLLIVPHGPLGQLPFGVLVTDPAPLPAERDGTALFANYRGVKFLARSAAITQLPSVTALASLRALPGAAADRRPFVGFGDPWFNAVEAAGAASEPATVAVAAAAPPTGTLVATRGLRLVRRAAPATETVNSADLAQLPRLPDTAEEVRQVALALGADPARDVFTGREANERRVRGMDLADRKVVMFATHGLVPGDLNGLTQPALALAAPDIAGGGPAEGDGLLTLDKVLALKLDADWVVLSACNTATGEGGGAEAVSGLGRAFFYAGTRAVLVSNWPVETTSARALTTDLFRRQAVDPGLSRAEALRQAELALIDGAGAQDASGRTLFSYAHPIFWAPFSLVGDGG